MMDWDSHRYLECFFAVPMMGAVLHTVNVRISPEQVLYTINHAQDDVILVNAEFLPMLEAIHDKIRPGVQARADQRRRGRAAHRRSRSPPSTSRCSRRAAPSFAFPDARREHPRHDVLHDRHDRAAEGRLLQPPAARAAHAGRGAARSRNAPHATFTARDVYMPITPMFHVHAWGLPYVATMLGVKQVYPGRYVPDALLGLIARERRHVLALRADDPADDAGKPGSRDGRPARVESDHRRLGAAAAARARRGRARRRHHRGLRHVGDLPDPHPRAPAPAHAATGTPSASCRTCAAPDGRFRSCSFASSTRT